jgi:AraC-like DNA-binding protein
MLGHLCVVAVMGLADDLVPGRRQARLLLPAILIAAALVSALSELLGDPQRANLLRAGLSGLPGLLVLALWLVRANPLALAFPAATPAVPPPRLDPRDADLAARLAGAMAGEQLWRVEGLSIDQLARHLGTPAHRLRTVINAGLGHRNFAAYVNGFRVAAAQAALADPARGRDTILAIAYESGFASLATFNRVFRDATGKTPSEYRDAALAAGRE